MVEEVVEEIGDEVNPDGLWAKLWIPKNDNLKPILRQNIGEYLYNVVEEMLREKKLRGPIRSKNGQVELQLGRGEDIPAGLISAAVPIDVGITGSDFVLATILGTEEDVFYRVRVGKLSEDGKPIFGRGEGIWRQVYRRRRHYTNPGEIIGKDLEKGSVLRFESDNRIVEMTILGNYDQPPFFSVLGANDTTFEDLIKKRKAQGRPVVVVWEKRFDTLAGNFLEAQSASHDFTYEFLERYRREGLTGSTEGYVRKGGEPERPDLADITLEIGRTFETADKNRLAVYEKVMQTYPVELVCYSPNQEGRHITLNQIVENTKPQMS